jgi:hypothetical protein
MKKAIQITGFILSILTTSCIENSQNLNPKGEDIFETHKTIEKLSNSIIYDTIYVPIYSEIYSGTKKTLFDLTATLSIRNTSMTDTIFISTIDYYNTTGELVRNYLKSNISLKPLETIDYVIEEKDKTGGTGSNFIIIWSAKCVNLHPVFQGVMISTHGQQGISYLTNGISISKR